MTKPVFLLVASHADSLVNFRSELIAALAGQGLAVHVAAPGLGADSAIRATLQARGVAAAHTISIRRTGMNPFADVVSLLDLVKLMRRIRPEYILAYTIKPIIYGLIAAKFVGVRKRFALITGLGYAFGNGGSSRAAVARVIARWLYRIALQGADKVFFQNPDDERLFRSLRLIPGTTPCAIVNGSGVNLEKYELAPLPYSPSFLLIARLLKAKGVREYVAAARQVKQKRPDAVFKIAGWIDRNPDSIAEAELEAWIKEGVIEYLGPLPDVRPAIAGCRVYVLPSYREGTPRTVLEAMAMGRPIITTDVPGCRETVEDGRNGYLVEAKSVESLINAMERMLQDPSGGLRMSLQSRLIAEERYDVDKVNEAMLREMGLQVCCT